MTEKASDRSRHYDEWRHVARLQRNHIDVLEKRLHAVHLELCSYQAECAQLHDTLARMADRTKDSDSFSNKVHDAFFPFTHYEDI